MGLRVQTLALDSAQETRFRTNYKCQMRPWHIVRVRRDEATWSVGVNTIDLRNIDKCI
jgi:hypothetical protein